MHNFEISSLPRLIVGPGSLQQLPELAKTFGRSILLIRGQNSNRRRIDKLISQLKTEGFSINQYEIHEEPSVEKIDHIVFHFRLVHIDLVVGIGGGSVLDAAKAVSAMLTEFGSVKEFMEGVGKKKPSGSKLPFIAVPTTAGTGSEATKNAVISDRSQGFKKSLRHDNYIPNIALLDIELTTELSPQQATYCAFDALTQLFEAFTSNKSNHFTDTLAQPAIVDLMTILSRSNIEKLSESERSKIQYAAYISGVCLGQVGLGLVHGIAGPLGGLTTVPHGLACARLFFAITPQLIKDIYTKKLEPLVQKLDGLAEVLNRSLTKSEKFKNYEILGQIIHDLEKKYPLPRLGQFGLDRESISKVGALADNKNGPVHYMQSFISQVLESTL